MKADWLLMRDVREELTKLRSRLFDQTGNDEVFESLLLYAWDEVCRAVEGERALNGGSRVRSLRTSPKLKPELPLGAWTREVGVRNYVGRPKWDILVDRVLRENLEEWSRFPNRAVESRIAVQRAIEKRREELVNKWIQEASSPPPSSQVSSESSR